jgi:glycosyltransferase involved in cell wall biosynthesis
MAKVSVLLPVYNGEKYLAEAIESVLAQSFSDFEFFILDDGSKDRSREIILAYQNKDSRIKNMPNAKNLGVEKTLNRGVSLSQGEYLARLDQDDRWSDGDKLKKQVEFLDRHPACAVLGTAQENIDEEGRPIQIVKFQETDTAIRDVILFSNPFAHPSVLIRKSALIEMGGYSEEKKYDLIDDYELWLRLGTKYELANLPDVSLQYRIHAGSRSVKNEYRQRLAWLLITFKYFGQYPHGLKAILVKSMSFVVTRDTLDRLTKKSALARALYAKLTGIQKSDQ